MISEMCRGIPAVAAKVAVGESKAEAEKGAAREAAKEAAREVKEGRRLAQTVVCAQYPQTSLIDRCKYCMNPADFSTPFNRLQSLHFALLHFTSPHFTSRHTSRHTSNIVTLRMTMVSISHFPFPISHPSCESCRRWDARDRITMLSNCSGRGKSPLLHLIPIKVKFLMTPPNICCRGASLWLSAVGMPPMRISSVSRL